MDELGTICPDERRCCTLDATNSRSGHEYRHHRSLRRKKEGGFFRDKKNGDGNGLYVFPKWLKDPVNGLEIQPVNMFCVVS